ncbi:MAG: hypothetical protein HZB83_06540, partial [Deltaproteobacteria bacterium]|nr:hypothetical protein [Deltaproteobacteria bacterium]
MAAPSKNYTLIADSSVDADSPLDTTLLTAIRDNLIHLEEWLGDSYTAAKNHNHDAVNSAPAVSIAEGSFCMGTVVLGIRDMNNTTQYLRNLNRLRDGAAEGSCNFYPHSPITIRDLYAHANAAPAAGETITITLRKNGVDTALTVTITNTATLVSDTTNTVNFGVQDAISFKCVGSAGLSSTIDVKASFRCLQYGSTNGESIIPFNRTSSWAVAGYLHAIYPANDLTVNIPVARSTLFTRLIASTGASAYKYINNAAPAQTDPNPVSGYLLGSGDRFAGYESSTDISRGSFGLGRYNNRNNEAIGIIPSGVYNQAQATTAYMAGIG